MDWSSSDEQPIDKAISAHSTLIIAAFFIIVAVPACLNLLEDKTGPLFHFLWMKTV